VNPEIGALGQVMDGLTLCNRILGFVTPLSHAAGDCRSKRGKSDVELYRKKRDLLCDGLASVGLPGEKAEGAFYLFSRHRSPMMSALQTPFRSGGYSPSRGAAFTVPAISGSPTA